MFDGIVWADAAEANAQNDAAEMNAVSAVLMAMSPLTGSGGTRHEGPPEVAARGSNPQDHRPINAERRARFPRHHRLSKDVIETLRTLSATLQIR